MSATFNEFYLNIINKRTKQAISDTTGKYIVMEAGSSTLQTRYTNDRGSTPDLVYNDVTSTLTEGGLIQFWTPSSVSSVDISILLADGRSLFIEGLTTDQHRIEVDTEKHEQTLVLPIYNYIPTPFVSASVTLWSSAGLGSIWTQGMAIPAGALVKDCLARVETLGTVANINIGVSGTPSGLLQGITGAVTGLKWPLFPYISAGTATFAKGTKFVISVTGWIVRPWFTTAATNIVFGNVTGTTLAAMTGWIYIKYDMLPNAT